MADEEKKTLDVIWGYCDSAEPEQWDGECKTREEAIKEGRLELPEGDLYVISGTKPPASRFIHDADYIIEAMGERAYDECGECAEEFPDVTDEAKAELNAFLDAWADKHCEVRFWMADGKTEKIEPLEQDRKARRKE